MAERILSRVISGLLIAALLAGGAWAARVMAGCDPNPWLFYGGGNGYASGERAACPWDDR